MKLKLKRPIVFFDLETTGVDIGKDRIVEIGIIKVMPDGSRDVRTVLIDPGIPIPKEASDIHGITDEKIKAELAPKFKTVAKGLYRYLKGCDLAGYNSNIFDIPLLVEEFARCKMDFPEEGTKMIDVFKIFKINESRSLSGAVKFYCGRELEDAHTAAADIEGTIDVFMAQIDKYDHLPEDIGELDEYCREGKEIVDFAGKITKDENGEYIFNFGTHKGKRVKDKYDYVLWMLGRDFPSNTKKWLRTIWKMD